MTNQERMDKLQKLEDGTTSLTGALHNAKILASIASPTLLGAVDEAIDRWNSLINNLPKDLKDVKLSLLEGGEV